jgi:alpha-1,2-mannosyltransferase
MVDRDARYQGQRFNTLIEMVTAFITVAVVLSLAWQVPGPIALDVGVRSDEAFLYLTNPGAPLADSQRNYRWVKGGTNLTFPGVGVSSWRVSLTAASGTRPDGNRVPLTVRVGDNIVFHTPQAEFSFYKYDFEVPASTLLTGDLSFTLDTPDFSPPNDPRVLGMAIDRIELEASSPIIPAPAPLMALAGAITSLYALLRFFRRRYTIAGTAIVALFVGMLVGWQRLLITPYALQLLLVGTLLCAGVYLVRSILSRYIPTLSSEAEKVGKEHAGPMLALILAVLLLYALTSFGRQIYLLFNSPAPVDFVVYHEASGRLLAGMPLYDLTTLQENPFTAVYKYPPFLSLLLEPLAALPVIISFRVWQFLNLVMLVVGLVALLRANGKARAGYGLSAACILLIVVTLLFRPLLDTLFMGQVDVLVFAGFALVYWALKNDRITWVGLPLAVITLLKLYPALFVIYLIMRREWKALASFALWLLALVAFTLPFVGVAPWWTYLTQVLPLSGGVTANVENQAFAGFFARFWTDQLGLLPISMEPSWLAPLVLSVSYAWPVFLLGMSYWFVRRLPARPSTGYDLGFATFVVACVLALPVVWYHYMTVLLVPIGISFFIVENKVAEWSMSLARKRLVLLALATVLLTYGGLELVWSEGTDPTGWWRVTLSYKLYGMALLWGCCLLFCSSFVKSAGSPPVNQPADVT